MVTPALFGCFWTFLKDFRLILDILGGILNIFVLILDLFWLIMTIFSCGATLYALMCLCCLSVCAPISILSISPCKKLFHFYWYMVIEYKIIGGQNPILFLKPSIKVLGLSRHNVFKLHCFMSNFFLFLHF